MNRAQRRGGGGSELAEFYRLAGGEDLPSRGRRLLIDYIRRAERKALAPLHDQLGPQPRETDLFIAPTRPGEPQ